MTKVADNVCKPLVISEFNTDGDVTGPRRQGESIKKFVDRIKSDDADWFDGFSMYQFRDRGRLGLEMKIRIINQWELHSRYLNSIRKY